MADKIIENNQVSMMGKIAAGFTFSHQVFGEGFYMTELLVKRLSDTQEDAVGGSDFPVQVADIRLDTTLFHLPDGSFIRSPFSSRS